MREGSRQVQSSAGQPDRSRRTLRTLPRLLPVLLTLAVMGLWVLCGTSAAAQQPAGPDAPVPSGSSPSGPVPSGLLPSTPVRSGPVLKGQLRDGAGKAIAGAQVILGGLGDGGGETAVVSRETTSDGAGRFVFTRLPAGTYTLTAGAMGMRSVPVRVMVDPSGPDGQPPVSLELAGSGGHDTASSPTNPTSRSPR